MAIAQRLTGKPYRHELKYIISEGEMTLMSTRLRHTLRQDAFAARNGGEYFIRSLYFDDPDDNAIWEKSTGIETRDKFRIRIYNLSDEAIKLERKHKEGSYIKKDSVSLTREDCEQLIAGDPRCLYRMDDPFARQMYGIFRTQVLRPKVLVDYTREPYTFAAEDVRVTFDKNVRTALRATDLFNPGLVTYPVWSLKGCAILEIKFNNSLPAYVASLVQVRAAQRTAASKYLFARQYEF